MTALQAVIFDLDDTLYPEREYAFSGFEAVATAFQDVLGDRREAAQAMRRLFDSQHRRRVFNALLAEHSLGDDPRIVAGMIETYRTHVPTITLHADADTALTCLQRRFKLGLITDGPSVSQRAKIDALELRPRLDEIIITSELGPGVSPVEDVTKYAKPQPHAFEAIAKRLGVEAQACAYVADNPSKDFIAPSALGWTTIRITRPDGIYRNQPVAKHGIPQHDIETLDQLTRIVT